MEPAVPANLEESKEVAKSAVLDAGQAAEQFRQDFKAFLSQVVRPDSWRDGLKLVTSGGLGLLKDLQEMITQHNWTPDKLVTHLDKDLSAIVLKHPELQEPWENVKISFHFAKLKTDEALAHVKEIAQKQVVSAVWSGVKAEIQKDLSDLMARLKGKKDL
ncbi:MAG: hypothetical protein AAB383_03905 [Patescibacteria group bacterium]